MDKPKSQRGERFVKVKAIIKTWTKVESIVEYDTYHEQFIYHSDRPTFNDGWSAAIWYLKKRNIQLQNQWKPSDEQMVALSIAMCGVDDPLFFIISRFKETKRIKL